MLGFTPDRRQLATALDTLGVPKLFDRAGDPLLLVLASTRESLQALAPKGNDRTADAKAGHDEALLDDLKESTALSTRATREAQIQLLRSMTKSYADLARLMSEVKGRKYVVYLSEGFDSTLITGTAGTEESQQTAQDRTINQLGSITNTDSGNESFGDTRSQNAMEKMLDEFRRADCIIEAVDIGGLRAGNDQGLQHVNGKEGLTNMARSTGGDFYQNFNDFSVALGQMVRRTGVTYVLSFQPDNLKPDNSFHKLRVELKNAPRGARVVARPGYYSPRPFKEQPVMQRLLEAGSDVLGEESGALATSVLAAPFAASGDHNAWVPVVIEVNGASLLAGKQDPKLPVEIYVYALDQNGSVQDFVTQTVGLDLTKAESGLRQGGLKFFAQLALPKGNYTLRTLVRNGTTGASSLRVTELAVPGRGESALLPAFFPEAPGRWVMVRQTLKQGQEQMPYPFMLKDQPFIPASKPVLAPGQEAQLVLQGYNLGAGDLKAEARVLAADGKEVPGGDFKLGGRDGAGGGPVRLVASFRPPALPPGDYRLRVTLTDGAGKAQTSMARFAVGGAAAPRGSR